MGEDFSDRRRAPRFPTRSLVEVKLPTWEALRAVYATNISLGGMRLTLGGRPPVGQMVDVILTLPDGNRLHLPGRIANLGPGVSDDVGIKFDPLADGTAQEMDRYIDDIKAGRDPGMKAPSFPIGNLIKT